MARNTRTRYKSSTDLRGKFVELRSGAVRYIPPDADRFKLNSHDITYCWGPAQDQYAYQITRRRGGVKWNNDIMKVLPLPDMRIDLRGRLVRLRNKEELQIPADAERLSLFSYVSYCWNGLEAMQGGAIHLRDIIKVLK